MREIVPERHARAGGPEHAARQALLEVLDGVAGERLEQRQVDGPGHDRGGVEHLPRRRAQRLDAGEHGVADRRGQLDAARGERLGHEERVPGRPAVQLGGVDAVRRGELRDGLDRQRREPQPVGRVAARELAERDPQRVGAVELVVAVAGDEQRRDGRDAAAEQAQHVERRLVGPVHVLEHDDRRLAAGQLAQQRRGDRVGGGAVGDGLRELAAGDRGDVGQRSERGQREERVAVAPEDPRRLRPALAEAAQEHGLADAGLARHEHEPAARAARRLEGGVEHVELRCALEERRFAARGGKGHGRPFSLLAASRVQPEAGMRGLAS